MKNLIIIGTSTTAKHVYHFVKEYNLFNVLAFSVNKQYIVADNFEGLPVYPLEELESFLDKENDLIFVAILWNHLNADRKNVYNNLKQRGFHFATLISPTAKIRTKKFGDNCWFHDNVIVQNNAKLGSDVIVMADSLIGANCKVGCHCFFGAHSVFAGGSSIGEQSFVGINAVVFDDTYIGKKCIIGSCTAVKRNMPNYSKYTTPSDNIIIKQYNESEIENKLIFSKNVR